MKIAIVIVVGLVAVTGGGAVVYFSSNPYRGTNELRSARSVSDTQDVLAKGIGYVEPISEVRSLSFKAGGIIGDCRVELGQCVNAGEVLMVLENLDEKAALAVAEKELELAQAQLGQTLSGVNPHEIHAAEWTLELARERKKHAEAEFARRKLLLKDNAVSRMEYDTTESLLRQAEADLGRAEEELECRQKYVTPEDELVAETQVKVAAVQRDLAAQRLANTVLVAPFDGTVLEILRREGEAVTAVSREPVILFADVSRLRVRAEIDERFLHELKPGQEVTVTGRSLGHVEYQGRISQVKRIMGKKSIFSRKSSEKRDLDVVEVFVEMDPDFHVPAGLRVDVAIRMAPETSAKSRSGV